MAPEDCARSLAVGRVQSFGKGACSSARVLAGRQWCWKWQRTAVSGDSCLRFGHRICPEMSNRLAVPMDCLGYRHQEMQRPCWLVVFLGQEWDEGEEEGGV